MEGATGHSNPETLPLFPAMQEPAHEAGTAGVSHPKLSSRKSGWKKTLDTNRDTNRDKSRFSTADSPPKDPVEDQPSAVQRRMAATSPGARQLNLDENATKLPGNGSADYHMAIAWRLSKAMHGVKSGHRNARTLRRMTPGQKHQVGNVICGHLLASLRAQVEADTEPH